MGPGFSELRFSPKVKHRRLRVAVLAAAGFTPEETAWLMDMPRHLAVRDGARADPTVGFPHRTDKAADLLANALGGTPDPAGIRAHIEDMKPLEAVDELLWLLESLLHHDMDMTLDPVPGLHLSPAQARLLHAMDLRSPHIISHEAASAAVWRFDPPDDVRNNLGAHIHAIRKKAARAGVPISIRNQCGVGWRLERPDGLLDWGQDNGDHRREGRERLAGAGGIDGGANGDHN